jgi:hypothetical protein
MPREAKSEMAANDIWEYSVQWLDPYTDPPNGLSRILAEARIAVPRGTGAPPIPADIERVWREANASFVSSLPPGEPPRWPWKVVVSLIRKRRQVSEEGRYKLRRGNAIRRIRRQYPLIAEEMIRQEFLRNPQYYGLTEDEARSWTLNDDRQD